MAKRTDGDVVVVVDADEISELQMAGQTGGFRGDALHGTAIPKNAVGVVADDVEAVSVEDGGGVSLSDGETDGVAEALAERAGGDLDAGGVVGLRMPRSDAAELAEVLEIIHGQRVAKEMQKRILKHASVAVPGRSAADG
jgi:hypothetical protein